MPDQNREDSFFPGEKHLLDALGLTVRPSHTKGADYCGLDIASAAHVVEFGLILDGAAEHVSPFLPLKQVGDNANSPHHCEFPILQEGDVANNPILGLILFEVGPLSRREEAVNVGDVQVFAKQARYLCPGPQRIVGDDDR